jgi:hypothetical protein
MVDFDLKSAVNEACLTDEQLLELKKIAFDDQNELGLDKQLKRDEIKTNSQLAIFFRSLLCPRRTVSKELRGEPNYWDLYEARERLNRQDQESALSKLVSLSECLNDSEKALHLLEFVFMDVNERAKERLLLGDLKMLRQPVIEQIAARATQLGSSEYAQSVLSCCLNKTKEDPHCVEILGEATLKQLERNPNKWLTIGYLEDVARYSQGDLSQRAVGKWETAFERILDKADARELDSLGNRLGDVRKIKTPNVFQPLVDDLQKRVDSAWERLYPRNS